MMKRKHSLLLFDFDGVICDSFVLALTALNAFAAEQGFNRLSLSATEVAALRHLETVEIFHKVGVEKSQFPAAIIAIQRFLSGHIASLLPTKGIVAALCELKQSNIRMGIVTSNTRETVSAFLKLHDVDYFEFIESAGLNKEEVLKSVVANTGHDPENVYYVGDEARDIRASRGANVRPIAVSWGFNAKELLQKHNPDHLFDLPSDLISFISALDIGTR